MLYISNTYLSYIWSLSVSTAFLQCPLLPPPASSNHESDFFFYELVFEVKYN